LSNFYLFSNAKSANLNLPNFDLFSNANVDL